MDSAGNTRILAYAERRSTALIGRVACDAFLQVPAGSRHRAKVEPRSPQGLMCEDSERGVVGLVRQVQQHFTELSCRVQLWSCPIKPPQAIQDRSKLWRLPYLLTQHVCLGISALHLGGCVPFRSLQCRAKGNVQGQCLLGMFRCLW